MKNHSIKGISRKHVNLPGIEIPEPNPGARFGGGAHLQMLGGWDFIHGMTGFWRVTDQAAVDGGDLGSPSTSC